MTAISTTQTTIPAGSVWTADKVHSQVGFAVKHMIVSTFRSSFDNYDATLTAAEDGTLRLEGTVDTASIVLKDENLAAHLAAPDFFDTERYPQLKFSSTAIELGEGNEATVRGELEIRGTTHEVEASGRIGQVGADLGGDARVGLSLGTRVDRRSFGLDWQADLPSGGQALDYEVDIAVELELVAEAE